MGTTAPPNGLNECHHAVIDAENSEVSPNVTVAAVLPLSTTVAVAEMTLPEKPASRSAAANEAFPLASVVTVV